MKKRFLYFGALLLLSQASAGNRRIVECRLITPKTTECKPYPKKLIFAEKLEYGAPGHKLIISKTLPPAQKPNIIKAINVEDMIERHLEVLESVRFRGSQPSPLRMSPEEMRERQAVLKRVKAQRMKIESELIHLKQKRMLIRLELHRLKKIVESAEALKQQRESEKLAREGKLARKKHERELAGKKKREAVKEKRKKAEVRKRKVPAQKSRKPKKSKLAAKLEKKYRYLNRKRGRKVVDEYRAKLLKTLKGRRKLRVQATAYTSHRGQTDKTPFLAAWNNRLRPGMKAIAVSRDLIRKYGLGNGKKVRIQGLPGLYTVRDKMNKRYTKRIDIYMGTNRRKALRWGRKRVVIYW